MGFGGGGPLALCSFSRLGYVPAVGGGELCP